MRKQANGDRYLTKEERKGKEMGRYGNSYQDMIDEITEKNREKGIDNSSKYLPAAGSSPGGKKK